MDLIKHFWYLIHVKRQKETVTVLALTSQMTPMTTNRMTLVSAISDNLVVVLDFLILQDKHYNLFVQALETGRKESIWRAFLTCFAASAN
jgi:hypothetical protein